MRFLILGVTIFLSTLFSCNTQMRGRPQLLDGTLVTDRGTLLRGGYIGAHHFELDEGIPTREDVVYMKEHGFNTIHLYTEAPQLPVGSNVEYIDQVVEWAEEEGLYVVMVCGGPSALKDYTIQEVKEWSAAVWTFYGTRYKDKTHVIFEIHNEPEIKAPYSQHVIDMMNETYTVLRSVAPESHIMMMSYSHAQHVEEILSDLEKLTAVDWGNASLAFHTYKTSPEDLRVFMNTIQEAGYNIMCTEPEGVKNHRINLGSSRVFEEEFVSYTIFVQLRLLQEQPDWYTDRVENSRLRWVPDFGTWPNDVAIPEKGWVDPFDDANPETGELGVPAAHYDAGKGWFHQHATWRIAGIYEGAYVGYYGVNFDRVPTKFFITTAGSFVSTTGTVEVRLGAADGELIATCPIQGTGSQDEPLESSAEVIRPVTGTHDLYLVFKGESIDYLFMRSFRFIE